MTKGAEIFFMTEEGPKKKKQIVEPYFLGHSPLEGMEKDFKGKHITSYKIEKNSFLEEALGWIGAIAVAIIIIFTIFAIHNEIRG